MHIYFVVLSKYWFIVFYNDMVCAFQAVEGWILLPSLKTPCISRFLCLVFFVLLFWLLYNHILAYFTTFHEQITWKNSKLITKRAEKVEGFPWLLKFHIETFVNKNDCFSMKSILLLMVARSLKSILIMMC
jgi:hypothetical protein